MPYLILMTKKRLIYNTYLIYSVGTKSVNPVTLYPPA